MFNAAETSRQIVKTLYPCINSSSGSNKISIDELHVLISAQLSRAPFYIYLAMTFLTGLFNLLPLLKWGATFCSLPAARQKAHAHGWKVSPVKIKRDFINFYESFIILGIYEEYAPANPAMRQSDAKSSQQQLPDTGSHA